MATLKNHLKKFLIDKTPIFIKNSIIEKFKSDLNLENSSYSQEGEDRVLMRFLEGRNNGFYVDVGAHHPVRFSNTFIFYLKGWRGINIDAMPGSMEAFNKVRPKDINLEIPVSDKKQVLEYFIFNEPALNTFSREEAERKDGLGEYRILGRRKLETLPLSDILYKYVPQNQHIDFMTIDVEGLDFEVLKSNDWTKFKPEIILVESLRSNIVDLLECESYLFLQNQGYEVVAKTYNTLFFKIKK